MRAMFGGVAGLVLALGLTACSSGNSTDTTLPPSGTAFMFVTTQADKKITPFTLDLTSGNVTANGDAQPTGDGPSALLLDPTGQVAFVLNSTSGDISVYNVKKDGTLTAVSGTTSTGAPNPVAMSMDAAGKFLFVANRGTFNVANTSKISVFQISGTSLTPAPGSPFATVGNLPETVAVAVTPDAKFLYAAHNLDNVVSAYAVDASGVLTQNGGTVSTGLAPAGLTVSPDGNFLYVTNSGTSSSVTGFAVCDNASPACPVADGSLTEMTQSPFSAGLGPAYLTADETSKFLYVVDQQSNQVSAYTITAGTGALVATAPSPNVSTGANPVWVTLSPDGNYAFVACSGASSIARFRVNTTSGALAVIQTVLNTGGQPSAIAMKLKN